MITVNINKARALAHTARREARSEELRPYDEIIMKQIPGQMETAEAARQAIREKYAEMQVQMDAAQTTEELKAVLPILP